MTAFRWNWVAPWQEDQDEIYKNELLGQAEQIDNFFANNPSIPYNMSEISKTYGFLPKDVQVAGALMGLTKDSPEFTSIVERFLEKETSWWEGVKAAGRGAVRGAVVGMESASQFVKKYGTASMKYYAARKMNPLLAFTGVGTLVPLLDPNGRNEFVQSLQDQGPTVATRAFQQLRQGKKVNLGEGYFGNSTVAEDTEVYKELVGRGANPDEVKQIIQEYYGKPITQLEMNTREGNAGTYRGRKGTVKLSPGRVAAVEVFEPGTKSFNLLSGIIDGVYTVVTDPATYAGGALAKAGKIKKSFNLTETKKSSGLIDNVVRKTVKVPKAREFYFETKTGDDIADLFAQAKTYDEVEILLGKQGKRVSDRTIARSAGGAKLYRRLRDTEDKQAIKNILVEAAQDPTTDAMARLDPTSLLFNGSLSKAAAKFVYGDKASAVGFRTAMKLNSKNSIFERLFNVFPAPRIQTDSLNDTFFELKNFMKFAKVDDDVATRALDRIVDAMDDEVIQALEGSPASLQKLNMMLDIYGGEGGVLKHIMDKFEAVNIPKGVVNQIGKLVASVDEANKYFYGAYGEEAWNLQKIDILDKGRNNLDNVSFNMEQTLDIIDEIISNSNFKKSGRLRSIQDIKDDFLSKVDSAQRVPTDIAEAEVLPAKVISNGGRGTEIQALRVAKELDIETGGTATPGFGDSAQTKTGSYGLHEAELIDYGLTDDTARQVGFIDETISRTEKEAVFKDKRVGALTTTYNRLKQTVSNDKSKIKGLEKAYKELELSPVRDDLKIQNKLQAGYIARKALDADDVRIKNGDAPELSVAARLELEAKASILRYATNLIEEGPNKILQYDSFDMPGYQRAYKNLQKRINKEKQALAKHEAQLKARLNDINDDTAVKKLETLQRERNRLTSENINDKMPANKYFVARSQKNIDDADITIAIFDSASNPAGKGTTGAINYARKGKWSQAKIPEQGVYQGNRPLVVVDTAQRIDNKFVQEIQELIKKYPTVNVIGPRTGDASKISPVLKTLFTKTQDAFDTKAGFKVFKNAKVSPNQILNYFSDITTEDDVLTTATNTLMKRANFDEIEAVVGRPTAHLISEYLASGALPLPDARLFLRVFSPAREFWTRIIPSSKRARVSSARKTVNLEDGREFELSEFEEMLAKPVADLFELQTNDQKGITDWLKMTVKTARKKFDLDASDADANALVQGWLSKLGDNYMNRAWKPFILIRGAWTARVVGEEQIRMWAADLDNVFTHPLSAFAWILGKDRQSVLRRVRGYEDLDIDRTIQRGMFGIRDNEILADSIYHKSSMSMSHSGILDGDKLKRTFAFKGVEKGDKGYHGAAVSEIFQLVDDPIAAEIATLKGGVDDIKSGLQNIKDRFWNEDGDLSSWRTALAYGSDEAGKYQKIKILNDRKWADDYIDSVAARVHYKTGGSYKVTEVKPDGTRIVFEDMEGMKRVRKSPQSEIEFELVTTGDAELLEHISKGRNAIDDKAILVDIDGKTVAIGRKATIGNKKTYTKWLAKKDPYKSIHVMKKSVFDMDGERVSSYDAAVERLFSIVMSAPTNRLSRSPAFRQFYWRFMETNIAYFDDGLRKQIKQQAQASNLPKSFIKQLDTTGKVSADEGKLLRIADLDTLDETAKAYALSETQSLLYDLNRRHVVSDMLRLAFPFAEVYIEIMGTWSRLLNQKKFLATRKITRGIDGARKADLNNDDEGFFHTDAMTGEEMFFFPGSEFLTNWMFEGNRDSRTIKNPVTGEELAAPDAKINLKGYVSSLNMIVGNPAPGLGPLVGIPASKILPETELIDKVFFPYGRETKSAISPATYANALIPSWLKKAMSMGASDPDMQRGFANVYKDVIKMFVTTGLYDDSTPAKQARMLEEAKKTAMFLTAARTFIQFAAPTGAVIRYDIEVAPGGQLFVDPLQTKGDDPKHHFYGMSILTDAYYRILSKYGGDQVLATKEFVNQFGLDPTALLVSKSKEIKKRSYTDEGVKFGRDNEEILNIYPDVGYYLFPDNPLDEFSFVAWADSFADRDRVDLSEDEYVTAVRQAQGRLAYEYQRRLLFESGAHRNLTPERKYEILTDYRMALRQEYPGYGQTSTTAKAIDAESKRLQLINMIQNEGERTVNLPNGDTMLLKELPSMQGLVAYLEIRDSVLAQIQRRDGPRATLKRQEYTYFREVLRRKAQELFSQFPDFYYVYDDILRFEVEEEFTDVFTPMEY